MRSLFTTLLCIICLLKSVSGQKMLDRISAKAGVSNNITQFGRAPFDGTRNLNRSITSIFFNLQYAQPISKKIDISLGAQLVEKGFRTQYAFTIGSYSEETEYQYRLHYFEVPVNAIYHWGKTGLILGIITSYMYSNDYRYKAIMNSSNTVYESSSYSPFPYKRLNEWDFGINMGISRTIYKNFDAEFNIQKHLLLVDELKQGDLAYNLCFLLGVRYKFMAAAVDN